MNALPQPLKSRWQPLRIGLIELYYYDVEEFWFEDGHLLLRGNNGTGKSKVLSLTLPFLLDGSLSPARLEPDADPGKRMDWNLLMGGRYKRRTGYAWMEFGRVDADGVARFVTLGAGLRATAGRSGVESWFFVSDQRVGETLELVDESRAVVTRERLAEMLGSHNVHTTARDYRAAIDERLFQLGAERYRALIDTLIQLRQPQLSKQPNEANLSRALSQALKPLGRDVLEDVAEAMNQLDEYQAELADYAAMRDAIARFNTSYVRYAQILARRRARTLRQAQTAVDNASAGARSARAELQAAQAACAASAQQVEATGTREKEAASQIDVLRASPEMRSAHELDRARVDADAAERRSAEAAADRDKARKRQQSEQAELARRQANAEQTRTALQEAIADGSERAQAAGIASEHGASWGADAGADALARRSEAERAASIREQQRLANGRDAQIAQVRKRLDQVAQALHVQQRAQDDRDARNADSEAAGQELTAAHAALHAAGQQHIADWRSFGDAVGQALGADAAHDWPAAEDALVDWVTSLDGPSPLQSHWRRVTEAERNATARADADLRSQQKALQAERAPLTDEQERLRAGRETPPPAPPTRHADRTGRHGAPFWQLLDFAPGLDAATRAGVEAALQASGLLDAWLSPAGELLAPDTQDRWLLPRGSRPHHLGRVLRAATADGTPTPVAAEQVQALLASIALVDAAHPAEPADAEAWIASDGRYRIGPAQGAWRKNTAEYIGYAAREAARQRRLVEIDGLLAALARRESDIATALAVLDTRRAVLNELQTARPDDQALRKAHAECGAADRRAEEARARLAEAETRLQSARHAHDEARRTLARDAEDAQLPATADALDAAARALAEYRLALTVAQAALRDHARALGEEAAQAQRVATVAADLAQAQERAQQESTNAASARARHVELERSVGASAAQVLARLEALETEQRTLQVTLETARQDLEQANKRLGAAEIAQANSADTLAAKQAERGAAVQHFQAFAATGLLRAAVPALALPDDSEPWATDPALATSRAAETALAGVDDDEAPWQRAQKTLSSEFSELQRALSARNFDCFGEPGEHGFVVSIHFNQRVEAPGALLALLESELAERRKLLSAKETEILENHLQAEIAAQLQTLIRAADERVSGINRELERRPTSTGVKFKLAWEPLPDEDGTLAHFAEARKTLLNKSADAWSPAERAAVGAFLQGRIGRERERDAGAARIDQLAAALDYRVWHRFRVRRWQDGQWRPLSGPASSGERALGLTVPLFAAAASHYESAGAEAPRLVLLDEAFAGIDDGARAHCMALIREFDLDFVMTSEREWACYAELPGVAICQLVRRADIDAVYVSRWRWNGRSRERAELPRAPA